MNAGRFGTAMGERESGFRRLAAFSILLYLTVLVLLFQVYSVARDFAIGAILDPWLALFPLVWVDLALVVLLLLAHGFLLRSRRAAPAGWKSWLVPDFRSLASALRPGPLRLWIVGASTIYLILLLFLQGVLVVDPSGAILPEGTEYPYADVFGGPVGWGPKLIWAPNPYFGVLLRPYTVASATLLAVLGGLGLGIVAHGWGRDRGLRVRNLTGTLSGAMVVCPACAASPLSAFLFSSFMAGAAGGAAGSTLGPFLALTTTLLIASVVAMWIGLARVSRKLVLPDGAPPSREDRIRRLGDVALLVALLLAVGALLVDLGQSPAGGGHTHGGSASESVSHAPSALWLGVFGIEMAGMGAALKQYGPRLSRRSAALVAGLTLLFADGVVHWLAVLEHVGSAPDVAFFLVVGLAQVVGVPVALRSRKVLWWLGVPLTAFLLGLYVATRLVALPFESEPEPFELLGLVSKALEASALLALAVFFGRGIVPRFAVERAAPDWPTFFLFTSLAATGITVLAEVAWSILPIGVGFALGLAWTVGTLFAARRRRDLAWAVVAGLLAGHLGYAAYYMSIALLWPLALCLATSAVSLAGLTLVLRERRASPGIRSVD